MEDKRNFRKEIRLLDGIMLVAGTMIGSGIFIVSSDIAQNVGSAGYLLFVWALSGTLTVIGALSLGELTSMYPHAGGQYVFLRESYNSLIAFLYGWTLFLVIQTGTIAAVGVAFAKFTGVFLPNIISDKIGINLGAFTISTQQFLAIAIIMLLTYINILGVKNGKIIQTFFGSTKIAALFGLIAIGIFVNNPDVIHLNFSQFWDAQKTTVTAGTVLTSPLLGWALIVAVGTAMVGSLFSMDAWNNITFAGDEIVNPKRNIPLSMAIGTSLVAIIYIALNLVYLSNLPLRGLPDGLNDYSRGIQFATNQRVAVAAVDIMAGHTAVLLVAALIMISTFSCLNGCILSGARVYYRMAADGFFFRRMSKLNKHGVPAVALIGQGDLGIIAMSFRNILQHPGVRNFFCAFILCACRLWNLSLAKTTTCHGTACESFWLSRAAMVLYYNRHLHLHSASDL